MSRRRSTARRPRVVLLDVNGTLSDLEPLRGRLVEAGAPPAALEAWFAATLRDGFALAAADATAGFRDVALGAARSVLETWLPPPAEAAARHVVDGLDSLGVHADVAPGLTALAEADVRVVTLTNGAARSAEALLERAGLAELVERHLSVEDAGRWKPDLRAYAYAAHSCGVTVERMALVAVHPWDVDGARRAGMAAAWLNRAGASYPGVFLEPTASGPDLSAVARVLTAG